MWNFEDMDLQELYELKRRIEDRIENFFEKGSFQTLMRKREINGIGMVKNKLII